MKRMELHCHSEYSNIKILDSINKPKDLINRAIEIGLSGIAITDHDCLSGHIKINQYAQEIKEKYPDFKIALGNEIYLVDERPTDKHYHFILIAKDAIGHKQLRKLSSRAWMNSYYAKGLERVDTLKSDIEEIVGAEKGHLIASTACLGGELDVEILKLVKSEQTGDVEGAAAAHDKIVNFILWCKKVFGEDFYLEYQPAQSSEQIIVNKRILSIAKCFNLKTIITTDAHYLKKEDRYVHKAYLNSKGGEREVDEFYQYAYLQTEEEILENLIPSFENDVNLIYEQCCMTSQEIYNKIEDYSLLHAQTIPTVEVEDYPKTIFDSEQSKEFPVLSSMFNSEDKIERYWVNECFNKMSELGLRKKEYIDRLEEEAKVKRIIGEKLGTNIFAYPVTLKHYIDKFWNWGSMVGAGRGSSCSGLNHFLLGVTQLDPLKWDLPWFRYMNPDRIELPDIDLDLCPSKRPIIIKKIKEERGQKFNKDIDDLSKKNLGCTMIATFGTEGTKSAILSSCRGYRSENFPDGIEIDIAQYLSSLIPQERGALWTLDEVLNGNAEKGRKPVKTFINEVSKYPGLLDIIKGVEGLISRRGIHASGVIFFDNDPYEFGSFMKAPNGEITTQYDLHDAEAAGLTKYDLLVTEIQDKLLQTIKFLQEDNKLPKELTLKEIYDKYFHPNILPIEDKKMWDNINKNNILNLFQFDSPVGAQAVKKIQPTCITELSDANGLMRLMPAEKGGESPLDKYVRQKNDINIWYNEMKHHGLTEEEVKIIEPYFKSSYGVPPSQEQMMLMLMDENICGFTIAEANKARKICAKKKVNEIPILKEQVLQKAKRKVLGEYIWKYGICPQMSYSFSKIHALAYTFIGLQTAYIATNWNPIYWNTACLVVNSGSLEEENDYEEDDEGNTVKKKEKTTDYGKIAKALGDIIARGIGISLVDINKSTFSFIPDIESNEILFGMKALNNVGGPIIEQIIANRPYYSLSDFMNRCPLNKSAMISLIKSGAFDKICIELGKQLNVHPRIAAMCYYLSKASEPKKRLTLQNFNGLLKNNLIPETLDLQIKTYEFNKYLKTRKSEDYYVFDESCENFYQKHFDPDKLEIINGNTCILQKIWDKEYKNVMEIAKDWLTAHQKETLDKYNTILFKEAWDKYATGSISSWEMTALCFYYHEHELININKNKYGIVDFSALNPESEVEYFFKRNECNIPIYKIYRIAGTVIGKNDTRSSISLLTTEGVVTVKFTKEYYAMANRQISEIQEDGTKKVIEKGWFTRGTKLLISGYRREDMFIGKTYARTVGHQLYKIESINEKGDLIITHDRENNGD